MTSSDSSRRLRVQGKDTLSLPPINTEAGGRPGCEVTGVRELSLPPTPTRGNTQERRLCTSPGQQELASPLAGSVGEPVLWGAGDMFPLPLSAYSLQQTRWQTPPPHPPHTVPLQQCGAVGKWALLLT